MRITESKLKNIIKEELKKHLYEGTSETNVIKRWDRIIDSIGEKEFLSAIFEYLPDIQIKEIIDYAESDYDIPYFHHDDELDGDDFDDDLEDDELEDDI